MCSELGSVSNGSQSSPSLHLDPNYILQLTRTLGCVLVCYNCFFFLARVFKLVREHLPYPNGRIEMVVGHQVWRVRRRDFFPFLSNDPWTVVISSGSVVSSIVSCIFATLLLLTRRAQVAGACSFAVVTHRGRHQLPSLPRLLFVLELFARICSSCRCPLLPWDCSLWVVREPPLT